MPRLLDQVRAAVRLKHYSLRTEAAYVHWLKEFILFHDKRRPADLGPHEISGFLSHLAVRRPVSASTQNQAASALPFPYKARRLLPTGHGAATLSANACARCRSVRRMIRQRRGVVALRTV